MLRWTVAQTKPREEEIAVANLINQDFNVFLPKLREHKGREIKLIPMFPRYVFVELDPLDPAWSSINGTRGIKRIITSSPDKPSVLPVGWVESMIAQGGILDMFMDALSFNKGDAVEFVDGPFKGHEGKVQWTANERVGLLIAMLGRETLVLSESKALRLSPKSELAAVR